jgi:uncharacterized protein YbjT (DUF2867 family)
VHVPDSASQAGPHRVLVTGATGYVGGHVLGPLVEEGYAVRAAARHPEKIRSLSGDVETVQMDAFEPAQVRAALEGVDTAYYLVHTLGAGGGYAARDREAAEIFGSAARDAGVKRIIYFGGLGREAGVLSEHLASRQEVGRLLAKRSGVQVVEFRASIVLGSGSTSFEMIRNLVEKLPVMTTPRWVRMPAQPISIRDVAAYLTAAVDVELPDGDSHQVFEVGGEDIVTYADLLRMYGRRRGLHRLIIPVPVLSPGLSGWWLHLFTPRQATVGRQLAESLRYPTVVTNDAARLAFPDLRPMGTEAAIDLALAEEDAAFERMLWSDELEGVETPVTFEREGRLIDSRVMYVNCPPEAAFDPIVCIGGERGWYAFDELWDLRGVVDMLFGGPGHRRGRRDQYALVEGDHLDFFRVEKVDPTRVLRLRAEMRLPGRGWLQYELTPEGDGTLVRQTAIFEPKGVLGRLYWYLILPFHHFVFNGTLRGIERECRSLVDGPNTCPLPGAYERKLGERASAVSPGMA